MFKIKGTKSQGCSYCDKFKLVNKIFVSNINIYNRHYILIGFITQPSENHYVSYFQNFYDKYSYSINTWFKYNDMKGYYIELKNQELSIQNIKCTEPCALFVYLKINLLIFISILSYQIFWFKYLFYINDFKYTGGSYTLGIWKCNFFSG